MSPYDDGDDLEAICFERLDADLEMAALEEAGRVTSRLRKRGICDHGWTWTRRAGATVYHPEVPVGGVRCEHCGHVFTTEAAWSAARSEARGGR